MKISSIAELQASFAALNQVFKIGGMTSGEYLKALTDLKTAADAADLPFIFSAADLLSALRPTDEHPPARSEPYFVSLEQLDAEPSFEHDYSEEFAEDSELFGDDPADQEQTR